MSRVLSPCRTGSYGGLSPGPLSYPPFSAGNDKAKPIIRCQGGGLARHGRSKQRPYESAAVFFQYTKVGTVSLAPNVHFLPQRRIFCIKSS
jgi:hypothetical protein